MKLIKLAVLGAAAYGAKKWLDENPNAKRQVREAADNAKVQARQAMDTAKQEVDKRRRGGDGTGYDEGSVDAGYSPDSETPSSSMFGTGAAEASQSPSAGMGAGVPSGERTS